MDISNEKIMRRMKSREFKCNRSMSMFEIAVMKHDTTRTIGLKHAQVRLRQPYFFGQKRVQVSLEMSTPVSGSAKKS